MRNERECTPELVFIGAGEDVSDALNIQLDPQRETLETAEILLVPDKQTEVVTYCAGSKCHASLDAAHELSALGYTNVSYYAGGKAEGTVAGLPTERGE